jgi:hypothetical protein
MNDMNHQSPTNEDLALSSLLSSIKAHRRAKAQQAYSSSKQVQAHAKMTSLSWEPFPYSSI